MINKIDESQDHAEWKMSGKERQKLYDFHYANFRKCIFIYDNKKHLQWSLGQPQVMGLEWNTKGQEETLGDIGNAHYLNSSGGFKCQN